MTLLSTVIGTYFAIQNDKTKVLINPSDVFEGDFPQGQPHPVSYKDGMGFMEVFADEHVAQKVAETISSENETYSVIVIHKHRSEFFAANDAPLCLEFKE